MNPEQPDLRRALADLDARLGRITDEVSEVRAGLSALARQAGPAGAADPEAAQTYPQQAQPQQARPGPLPAHSGGPWRAPGRAPQQPRPARRTRLSRSPRITAATVIAAIGGTVMLAGIVFLLVVAIQAGLFPPIARVIGAALLAAVLFGLGLWLQSRHEPTEERPINPGALALVGTGLAAAMLDVIAGTSLYHWIPMPAAYMFVGGLALVGMVLAQRWSSGLLACLVSAGTMLLAPLISHGVELPIFVVIVGAATAVLAADLGTVVRIVWSVIPAFLLTGYLSTSGTNSVVDQSALIVTAVVFAGVGAGVAWYDTLRRSPAVENAGLVVVPTALPLIVLPTLEVLRPGWPVGLVLAAAYLASAVLVARHLHGGDVARLGQDAGATAGHDDPGQAEARDRGVALLSAVLGSVGSVLLVAAWGTLGGGEPVTLALTLTAIAYVVAAGLWARPWVQWAAGIISGLALIGYLAVSLPFHALSVTDAVGHFTYWDVVASFAITVLAGAVTWWALRRRTAHASRVVMAGAVTALATLSVMIVAAGVVIGDLVGAARNGFLGAHLAVTVLWICCAAWLVLTATLRIADARRLGFVLGALALAKLLFLDLATLPGLFRVLSFIVVGAVMLAVAVRYRGGNDDDNAPHRSTGPSGSGPGGPAEQIPDYRSDTDPSGSGSPT